LRTTMHTRPTTTTTTRPVLHTVAQAADQLNTTVRFVRRLIAERRIPYHKIGRHVRIAEADVNRLIATGWVEASR
jgi:excisionase family DNA binding protein